MSVLWFTDSDYPFGIFKLFLPLQSIWAQPVFCGVHGALSLVFCVVFCRSLLLVFFCQLYCLSLDDLRILITLLVSSNSSCPYRASELNPSLRRVYGAWSLVFCVVFCRSLLLDFFCRLYCLSFDDLRILITLLVSSNSSCPYRASELNPSLRRVYGAWSLVFCAVFCRSLFFFCFVCPLYCLSFDIRILITTLVSSNSSCPYRASELNPSLRRVYGAWSLVFCVVFCRSLLLGFFCRLYCLSFDDLRILITLLISSNSSCPYRASELNPSLRGVYGAWSLVFCAVFCRSLVFFVLFVHCIVFPSTYGFWLPLWYLQTLLVPIKTP